MQSSNRVFRPVRTAEEERRLLEDSIPKSTRESTKWVCNIFKQWQMGRANKDPRSESCSFALDMATICLDTDIMKMSAEALNLWLTKFIQEVCKANGERYPARTLYSTVCGIQRHLNMKNGSLAISLLAKNEMRLTMFRQALDAEMRKASSDGIGKNTKMVERSEEDENILWEKGLLGDHTAKCLLSTIYFYNGKLFGLRSKEHRGLRLCNFHIESSSVTYDESISKNYHGGLKDLKYNPRVVRHVCCTGKDVNHTRCIVKLYAKYVERIKDLAEKRDAFYFKPNPNPNIFQFYDMVMGVNTWDKILPSLCESAGISTSYCLRVTCATRLFHGNVEEKLIRERTGHQSNALMVYERKSEQQELRVSNLLGPPNLGAGTEKKNEEEIGADFLFDFDVPDEVLCDIPLREPQFQRQEKTRETCVLSSCVFNNCTIQFGN